MEKAELVGLDERESVISISCGPTWLLCLRMPVVRFAAQEIEGGCTSEMFCVCVTCVLVLRA